MKKILFSAYKMDLGGIETALVTLLKSIYNKYEITLVLEEKEGIFLKEIPDNIKIITYKPSKIKNVFFRKVSNFFKQLIFKVKHKNKFDFSACYATYSQSEPIEEAFDADTGIAAVQCQPFERYGKKYNLCFADV